MENDITDLLGLTEKYVSENLLNVYDEMFLILRYQFLKVSYLKIAVVINSFEVIFMHYMIWNAILILHFSFNYLVATSTNHLGPSN